MWLVGPSTSSSTRLARPFQILRIVEVPSYSIQVVEPVRGCWRRFRCVCQMPISKSKSCWGSRGVAGDAFDLDGLGFCWARHCGGRTIGATAHNKKKARIFFVVFI